MSGDWLLLGYLVFLVLNHWGSIGSIENLGKWIGLFMSIQLDRLLQIILMLPQQPYAISRQQIQNKLKNQRFTVNERMVQRDIEKIVDVFAGKIVCEPYPNYANRLKQSFFDDDKTHRYYWRKDYKELKLVGLNLNQALSLRLIDKYLVTLLPKTTLDDLEPLFTEAAAVLDHYEESPLTRWPQKIAIIEPSQPLIFPTIKPDVQLFVSEALLSDRQLKIIYRRYDGVVNEYALNPIGLVLRNGSHYLIATKVGTQDKRQFALHRIQEISILDEPVEASDCNLEQCLQQGQMGFNLTGEDAYSMIDFKGIFDKITANHLSESKLSEQQTILKLDDDHYEITATIKESEQLYWWLLSFGSRIEVKEPPLLREKIAKTARAMLAKYQDD